MRAAQLAATMGALALGIDKGQQVAKQRQQQDEDRQRVTLERERADKAYQDDQDYKAQRQQIMEGYASAIQNDPSNELGNRMVMYEKLGNLDAKHGKAKLGDLEATRKAIQGVSDENEHAAYANYLASSGRDLDGTIDAFNKTGKKKVDKASVQAQQYVDQVSGMPSTRFSGKFEDGTTFSWDPLQTAHRIGGYGYILDQEKSRVKANNELAAKIAERNFDREKLETEIASREAIAKGNNAATIAAAGIRASGAKNASGKSPDQLTMEGKIDDHLKTAMGINAGMAYTPEQSKVADTAKRIYLQATKDGDGSMTMDSALSLAQNGRAATHTTFDPANGGLLVQDGISDGSTTRKLFGKAPRAASKEETMAWFDQNAAAKVAANPDVISSPAFQALAKQAGISPEELVARSGRIVNGMGPQALDPASTPEAPKRAVSDQDLLSARKAGAQTGPTWAEIAAQQGARQADAEKTRQGQAQEQKNQAINRIQLVKQSLYGNDAFGAPKIRRIDAKTARATLLMAKDNPGILNANEMSILAGIAGDSSLK